MRLRVEFVDEDDEVVAMMPLDTFLARLLAALPYEPAVEDFIEAAEQVLRDA